MAFTINNASGSNLVSINRPSSVIPLNYTLNTGSKWIYANYPEVIPSNAFGDKTLGNRYLTQVNVGAGTHQIFYSHYDNNGLGPFKFGIQVYNPNTSTLRFQRLYDSHRDTVTNGGWGPANGGVWVDFFNSSSSNAVTIDTKNRVHWVRENNVPIKSIFTGNMRFSVDNNAIITLYIYRTQSQIDGTATPYPWNGNREYSGYGSGYFYTASPITLNASDLTNGRYFLTNYKSGMTSLTIGGQSRNNDTIPLTLATGQQATAPGFNLGNWGVQYYYTLNLVNNTSSPKTFEGYVRCDNPNGNWPVIQSGLYNCKYASLGPEYGSANAWKWLSKTVAANSSYSDSFQYILGTNSTENFTHIFKAV